MIEIQNFKLDNFYFNPGAYIIVLKIVKFDIRICFEIRISDFAI